MTRKRQNNKPSAKASGSSARSEKPAQPAREPVDVHEGIPDCAARRPAWRWIVMAAAFVGWVVFLGYCWLSGSPGNP